MNCKNQTSLKYAAVGLLAIGALSALVACSNSNQEHSTEIQPSISQPENSFPDETGSPEVLMGTISATAKIKYGTFNCKDSVEKGKKCFTETYKEPATNSKTVDILFVVQTSESLAEERSAIGEGIKNFVASLPANSSYNVGVMLAHGSTSAHSGKLYQAATEPVVLKSGEMTSAEIQEALSLKVNQVVVDADSGGGEEGMFSLFRGITTPSILAESQASGFFRSSAALAVVFVAGNRDICAIPPLGVPAETDPVKIDARVRDCEGLTAAGLTNRLKMLKGTQALAVSGVIYEFPVPREDGNEMGYGYLDMINLNNGVAIDIATDDIAAGLSSIGQLSGQQMARTNTFTLSHTGVDPKSLKVTVNGVKVAYTLVGDVVTITKTIPADAIVVFKYCVKSASTTICTHKHGKANGLHCIKARHPHGEEGDNSH